VGGGARLGRLRSAAAPGGRRPRNILSIRGVRIRQRLGDASLTCIATEGDDIIACEQPTNRSAAAKRMDYGDANAHGYGDCCHRPLA
jgi:hypothetical protein